MSNISRRSLITGAVGAVVGGTVVQTTASAEAGTATEGRMCLVRLDSTSMEQNGLRASKRDGRKV